MSFRDYFQEVASKKVGNLKYEGWQLKPNDIGSAMVLFSNETMTPLAVFALKGKTASVLVTQRQPPAGANEAYFQGMLNNDGEFSFVIMNLAESGTLNINILHTPHRVSEVDPGPAYGVNQVNEIRAGQAYVVEADQRTGRSMILKGITKKQSDNTSVPMTVDEDEKDKSAPERKGTYYYLSVVAQSTATDLIEKFKEGTTWRCVNHFVRKTTAPLYKGRTYEGALEGAMPIAMGICGTERRAMSDSFDDTDEMEESSSDPFEQTAFRGGIHPAAAAMDNPAAATMTRSINPAIFAPALAAMGNPAAPKKKTRQAAAAALDGLAIGLQSAASDVAAAAPRVANAAAPEVGKTQAATVEAGREVEVRVGFTGYEYAYEYPSAPTVISLSLWKDMVINQPDNLVQVINAELDEWSKDAGKTLIALIKKVYADCETCVIDLESPPDTIVASCGHKCINHKNVNATIRNCPLCRGHVTAFIRDTGEVV